MYQAKVLPIISCMIVQNVPADKDSSGQLGTQKGHKGDMSAYQQLLLALPDVLNHLYDLRRLQHSPLVQLLHLAHRPDRASLLQQLIVKTIEALKPEPRTPPQSRAWRIYDLLFYRYVQQFSQREVADQVGLSVRHLRREQQHALEMLASRLWEQAQAEGEWSGETTPTGSEPDAASPTINDELAWLEGAIPEKPTALGETLLAVISLAEVLAAQHGTRITVDLPETLPHVPAHPVALRQILLSLLKVAIQRTEEEVLLSARSLTSEVEIRVASRTSASGTSPTGPEEDEASLEIAYRLARLCQAILTVTGEIGVFTARLTLPVLEQVPVLVIDDNADTLQLLQRYTSGTRYQLIGAQRPDQALSLAEEFSPQVILLDVMMPDKDGWEVLGWLRQQPATVQTPIIVCTILAQEELALSLGASAFIRKPVTRQMFLAALDQQSAAKVEELR